MDRLADILKERGFILLSNNDIGFDVYALENANFVFVVYHHREIWGVPVNKIDLTIWRKLRKEEVQDLPLELFFSKSCVTMSEIVSILTSLGIKNRTK